MALSLLVMFAVANAVSRWYLDAWTPNLGYAILRAQWRSVIKMDAAPNTVALGDSTGLHGFDPTVAGRLLGGRVLNLCTVGDAIVANAAAMLEHMVANGKVPDRVFLVHSYDVWHRAESGFVVAQAPLTYAETRRDFRFLTWTGELTSAWWADRLLPAVVENGSVVQSVKGLLRGSRGAEGIRGLTSAGFLPISKPAPDLVERDVAEHLKFVRTHRPVLSAANRAALAALVQTASASGIELIVVFGPVAQPLADDVAYQSYIRDLRRLVEASLPRDRRGVSTLGPRSFPAEEMENADHLVGQAAEVWTQGIVRQALGVEGAAKRLSVSR